MNNHDEVKYCKRCIMNSRVDPSISFDEKGICKHCLRYDLLLNTRIERTGETLTKLITKIKKAGKRKDYDCIIGVSGGVDSTYVAYIVKKLGLRPLAIHLDNGWNSELAVSNIEKVLKKLDIDLYTHVLDWEEFKDLQLSFLKASTPDGEIPTDHAINALLWKEASKRNIKYIISGMNFATESIAVLDWSYGHSDWKYIKNIHKQYGSKKLKTYPRFSLLKLLYINIIKGVRVVSILNYLDYNKAKAMDILVKDLGWTYYGGKHYESVYTRFYQSYVLPIKFGIDKRYGHLSDLINSGQITREEALKDINQDICNKEMIDQDKDFIIKKLDLTLESFEKIIKSPVKSFRDYKTNFKKVAFLKLVVNFLRGKGLYFK